MGFYQRGYFIGPGENVNFEDAYKSVLNQIGCELKNFIDELEKKHYIKNKFPIEISLRRNFRMMYATQENVSSDEAFEKAKNEIVPVDRIVIKSHVGGLIHNTLIHGRLSKVGEYTVTLFEKYGIEYKEDDF